jgi:hypothetical protein
MFDRFLWVRLVYVISRLYFKLRFHRTAPQVTVRMQHLSFVINC